MVKDEKGYDFSLDAHEELEKSKVARKNKPLPLTDKLPLVEIWSLSTHVIAESAAAEALPYQICFPCH